MTPVTVPWWLCSIIANACFVSIEKINRTHDGSWLTVLPVTIWPILLGSFFLFKAFNGASHWLAAWLVFTVGGQVIRLSMVWYFHQAEVARWDFTTAGVALVTVGALLVKRGMA